jgi:LAO/AO transport system kinase
MATRGHLGGLALATPQAVRVLDAAGAPWVLLETVGVGQVEVEVAGAADTTLVVVNPGWGDAVQANKAGLLEIADVFVINKADRDGAGETARDLRSMLEMTAGGGWRPPIVPTVAATGEGVAELWDAVLDHRRHLERSGLLAERRARRIEDELRTIVARRLEAEAVARTTSAGFERLKAAVVERRLDPYTAADELLAEVVQG